MQHELRYRGELLGFHESAEAAAAHARAEHGFGRPQGQKRTNTQVEDPEALTIEPRRVLSLYVNGRLVDTFHTQEAGQAAVDTLIEKASERAKRRSRLIAPLPREAYVLAAGDEPPPSP